MSGCVLQTRVIKMVHSTLIPCFRNVTVNNNGPVECNLNPGSPDINFLGIPFAEGFEIASFGRNNTVY